MPGPLAFAMLLALAPGPRADGPPTADSFRAEVDRIAAAPLLGIDSVEAWKARRPELQRQLRSMLGLDPMPERTDLEAEVRGVVDRPEFVVERLLFQSSPGLYVSANLYRPKEAPGPLPAVLYLCGHAAVVRDGVILGSKAHYQHHAAWYAANGYVCLVVDTLQLGEVPGIHHGTYREGRWWWQSRGYTPAGIEVWNAIRALDYLESRPEVDPTRIGVTGRSGGGAISWYLAAVDDRPAAVVPVAGITDLHDHLIAPEPTGAHPSGVIEGHCDCMYLVNTFRWDFDTVAALVAPRPLLVENTDRDPIFPEAGVRRIFGQLERVYSWYDARDRLGLVIGEGGHVDSEELRHASFAFMNTFLKAEPTDPAAITEPDRRVPIEMLKVLDPGEAIPADSRNATIDETFVPEAAEPPVPSDADAWQALRDRWLAEVRDQTFGGWPSEDEAGPLDLRLVREERRDAVTLSVFEFNAQPGLRPRIWILAEAGTAARRPSRCNLVVVPEEIAAAAVGGLDRAADAEDRGLAEELVMWRAIAGEADLTAPVAIFWPRLSNPDARQATEWTHFRRRFPLVGQTLDGMRVWDLRRAIAALDDIPTTKGLPIRLSASGTSGPLALWASVFEPGVDTLRLSNLPASHRDGPIFLNLGHLLPEAAPLAFLYPRPVHVSSTTDPASYRWASTLAEALGHDGPWPVVEPPGEPLRFPPLRHP